MRTIIAGGRWYDFSDADIFLLDNLRVRLPITSVISGGCRSHRSREPDDRFHGADYHGELWAEASGIPLTIHPADWIAYGRAAGPMRNQIMVNAAQCLIAFPGGRGTADVTSRAIKGGLKVIRISQGVVIPVSEGRRKN